MLQRVLLSISLLLFAGGIAEAVVVLGAPETGSPFVTDDIDNFVTDAHDMDGLRVEAFFEGGGSSVATWVSNGTVAGFTNCNPAGTCPKGNAIGSDWELVATTNQTWWVSGFDDAEAWTLTNNHQSLGLTRLTINGAPGQTVFDIIDPGAGDEGTDNSDRGAPFAEVSNPSAVDGTAIYRNEVSTSLHGFVHQGDVYEMLDITFTDALPANGGVFSFKADTDNATSAVIPEPSAFLFLGLIASLAGLWSAGVKRIKSWFR